ncbi:MAG: cytochrome c3 family protein [bacterium]|nr:cytochrome c3 family protein [bacterium]
MAFRMMKRVVIVAITLLIGYLTLSGAGSAPLLQVMYPSKSKMEVSTPHHYLVGDVDTFTVTRLELSRTTERIDQMTAKSGSIRSEFVKKVSGLFSRDFQITNFEITVFSLKPNTKEVKHSIYFPAQNRVNRDAFWQSHEFQSIYEKVFKDSLFRGLNFVAKGNLVSHVELSKRRLLDKLGSKFVMRVDLSPGQNDYTLRAMDNSDRILEEHRYSFLYKPAVSEEIKSLPGYEAVKFHTPEQEQNCASCHRMKPNASELTSNTATVRLCYPCHVWVTASTNVHYPITEWNCFYCHSAPKSGESGFDVSDKRKSDQTCFECHEDLKDALAKTDFPHAPAGSGDCLICHNPHGSDFRGMSVMKPNDLCLSCHEKKYSKDHPVMMHPVQGVRDSKSPKQELSCVSCHNPHYGSNEKLFYKATGTFQLCQECHKK